MSRESDNNSSKEDIELTELDRRPDSNSDPGSSADLTTSYGRSIAQAETSEDEAFYSAVSFLNSSEENNLAFDICRTSSKSLEGKSSVALTRKASSLEGLSTRRIASKYRLEGPSTRNGTSSDPLEKPLSKRVSSLVGLTTRRFSSLERPSIRRVSSLNPLEGPSISRASFLYPLKGSSNKGVFSIDPLEEPSTRRSAPLDPLEGPSTRRGAPLDPLEGPSMRRGAPLDPLEGPSMRRVASLDPLERPSMRRVAPLDPLEGPSTRSDESLDPLEGPSTRTEFFSGSAEGSLSDVFQPDLSEMETIEYFYSEPPAEQNGPLAWLNSFLRRLSRQIRHSVYYPVLLVALLAIPYSAGYMGCTYHYLCDGCPKLPHLLYLVGILGMLILFLQLTAVLSKRYFSPHLNGQEFNTWMVTLCFPFFMLLVMEMSTVFLCEPVFIPPHKEFCARVFYNYAYYVNIAVPIVILLLMMISIPGYYDPSEDE